MTEIRFVLNGAPVAVDVPPDMAMLWVLRDTLGATGPKYGCGVGVCRPAPATSTARPPRRVPPPLPSAPGGPSR
jgi:xanthine dehydrogenase iron-sulfur cluster and FAD-binding subunit A